MIWYKKIMPVLAMILSAMIFGVWVWDFNRKREYNDNFCLGYFLGELDYIREHGHRITDYPEFYHEWLYKTKSPSGSPMITQISAAIRAYQENKAVKI